MGTGCAPPHSQSVLRLQAMLRARVYGKPSARQRAGGEQGQGALHTAPTIHITFQAMARVPPCGYFVQAEGLTVKTGKARYTPLFLSKADLDIALGNADGQRCAFAF